MEKGEGGREFCVGRHSNITLVQLIQFVLGFSLTPISAYRLSGKNIYFL